MIDARLDMIRGYVRAGWAVVPIPSRSKAPTFDGWEQLRVELEDVERYFAGGNNVGLILGIGGLVDVDLDSAQARALAPLFLPRTGLIHGRPSKPRSHWWYVCAAPPATIRRADPQGQPGDTVIVELRGLAKHGGPGAQTVVPPSLHKDNELLAWVSDGAPAEVEAGELAAAVDRLAACALLARHWPGAGRRHELALALAGALARRDWAGDEIEDFILAAARVAGDEELADRERAVRDTLRGQDVSRHLTGLPMVADILGPRIADRLVEWLGLNPANDGGARIIFDEPVSDLPPDDADPRELNVWRDIIAQTPLAATDAPYWMERLGSYLRPFTRMFPDDWPLMVALPFWSAFWPGVRIQNLNLVIWTLGVGIQGSGKNTATDELHAIASAVVRERDQGMVLFTAGSPEGIWDSLNGVGKQLLCYHAEFGGFLKLLRRDHMSSAREALCDLYDGRAVGYLRAQKNGIEIIAPHVVVAATINRDDLVKHADPQDMVNGYISRFLICAPNQSDLAADYYPEDGPRRQELVEALARHVRSLRDVRRVVWEGTDRVDPPLLNRYREHLGMNSGRTIDLDNPPESHAIPPGRLVARVKKLAALFALAEYAPLMVDSETVAATEQHLSAAIDLVEHGRAYALRLKSWVGVSGDYELSHQIMRHLADRDHGMTQRELCQRTHSLAKDVFVALRLLEGAGLAQRLKSGKTERWQKAA